MKMQAFSIERNPMKGIFFFLNVVSKLENLSTMVVVIMEFKHERKSDLRDPYVLLILLGSSGRRN